MKTVSVYLLICIVVVGLFGCGGNSTQSTYNPPPPPAVSIVLSANSATVQSTGYNDAGANQFQFTATVQNATDTTVIWDVNGQLADMDTPYGRISSTGLYTAPMMIPSVPIQIHVKANADKTKSATANLTLQWSAQLYNLQVASSVETSSSTPIQVFFDTYGPKDLTWTVNGAEMGSAAAGAVALDYTGVSGNYIAPATAPTVPVRVTAALKSNGKSISKDITINANTDPSSPNIVITPASATLEPGTTQAFSAKSASDGNPLPGLYWTTGSGIVGGYTHVLNDGVLRSDGTYTAPFDVPNNRVVVVTASSNGTTTRKGYAIVNLADPAVDPNSRVNGQYAFSFHDSQYASTAFGTLVADGHGKLTGRLNIFTSLGSLIGQSITGTYTVHADGRVQASISYPVLPGQTLTQPISLILVSDARAYASSNGDMGNLVGTVEKQDPTAFSSSALLGDYGFLVHGASYAMLNNAQVTAPYAWGGVMTLKADGTISGAGTWDDGAARDQDITGSYTFDSTTGCGTLTVPTPGGPTFNFNFAVISAKNLILVSADDVSASPTAAILDGWAERRTITPPFTVASLKGPFVFYLSGQQMIEAGHFSADGAGGLSQGLLDMRYSSGSADPAHMEWTVFDGTYSLDDDAYGRGRLHLNVQPQHTTANVQQYARFYIVSPDKLILLMDSMTSAITGESFQETLSTGVPENGRYAVHFVGPDMTHYATGWTTPLALAAGTPWVGWLDAANTAKQEWEISSSGAQLGDVYTFNVMLLNGQAFPNMRAYAISPSKYLLIGIDMGYSGPNEFVWMEKMP